jgi:hypothetical protein
MYIPIPVVFVLHLWSRQDINNKGNFFCSVSVENMKTDRGSAMFNIHLQTEMKRKAPQKFSVGKMFPETVVMNS